MIPTGEKNKFVLSSEFDDPRNGVSSPGQQTPSRRDQYTESDDRPMAPRVSAKANVRSRSDIRSSKKEDFRLRLDDRLNKMRKQEKTVDGLVAVHAIF